MKHPARNGLAISPYELGCSVPSQLEIDRRKTTNHHNQHSRAKYADVRYRSVFRNLVTNVYPLLREEHTDLHNRFLPPIVPSDNLMIDVVEDYLALNGVIDCVREKKTNDIYQIYEPEWQSIKGLYRKAA